MASLTCLLFLLTQLSLNYFICIHFFSKIIASLLFFHYLCTKNLLHLIYIYMSTVIYPSPIFGPVRSRRLGVSLGINLMPADGKLCSFDCIYCECGFNAERRTHSPRPTRESVAKALEAALIEMTENEALPDVLTFAGNGEPTGHPHFLEIITDTIALRDKYCPEAKVSVLSNATFADRDNVREALLKVDNNILKLDTVDEEFIKVVDRPAVKCDVTHVIDTLASYNGHCIIQTMFLDSNHADGSCSNVHEQYVAPWLEALQKIRPQQVMIYTIDRETPDQSLIKATPVFLDSVRDRVEALGINCQVSY